MFTEVRICFISRENL